jgi:hypothetical protein
VTPRERARIDKLRAALDAGELWRAREILSGRIGFGRYDPATYEQLGQVLLRMGDDLQAGKYLFLSGVRKPDYAASIALYLRRHKSGGWQSLLGTFPASARGATWTQLPPAVREDLRNLGVPPRPDGETIRKTHERQASQITWRGLFSAVGCLLVVSLLGLLVAAIMAFLT